MTEDEVFEGIVASKPGPDEILFIGRSEKDYVWRSVPPGEPMSAEVDGVFLNAWMFSNVAWPTAKDVDEQRRFFDDWVAEMDTMDAGVDRCRWEFDDPYGLRH